MAQIPAKTKDHPDVQQMHQRRDAQTRSNEEAMHRMESTQPTPTQEENDLAKMGVLVDDKEPDGSGPTVIRNTTVANVPLGTELSDFDLPTGTPQDQAANRERVTRERSERAERERSARAEREKAERERAAQQAKPKDEGSR